jgi:hypothetical protein
MPRDPLPFLRPQSNPLLHLNQHSLRRNTQCATILKSQTASSKSNSPCGVNSLTCDGSSPALSRLPQCHLRVRQTLFVPHGFCGCFARCTLRAVVEEPTILPASAIRSGTPTDRSLFRKQYRQRAAIIRSHDRSHHRNAAHPGGMTRRLS